MSQRILFVQYTNPAAYPPLEHSSRILADAGWDVTFLGTGSMGQANDFAFPAHPRIGLRLWRYRPPGLAQKLHFLAFCVWIMAQAWHRSARWIYASDLLACPGALAAARLLGCRVIYHEHDSPPPSGGSVHRLLMRSRASLARHARACVLPNATRAAIFARDTGAAGEKVLCVWNCPERREVRGIAAGTDDVLFYHGSLNTSRLPYSVLRALAMLPERLTLRFAGYATTGHETFVADFLREAKALGVGHRVSYIGAPAMREELLAACRQCSIGMAFMPASSDDLNMRAMAGASNKPFDYLSCGLALLVSDLPEWRDIFVEPGYALACDPTDAASIARAVRSLLDRPSMRRDMGERGRAKVLADWNYETQFAPVLAELTR